MYRSLAKAHGRAKAQELFDTWFADYDALDAVDTGVEDLTREPFVGKAKRGADLMKARMHPVPGSNRVLGKLITGRWDEQFMVKAPGETITRDDFLVKIGRPTPRRDFNFDETDHCGHRPIKR